MSDRDELAKLLFTIDNGGALDPEHEWEMATRHYPLNVEYVHIMADAVLAAGYRKSSGLAFPPGYVPSEHFEEVCCKGIVLCEECLSCGDSEAAK